MYKSILSQPGNQIDAIRQLRNLALTTANIFWLILKPFPLFPIFIDTTIDLFSQSEVSNPH